MKEKCWRSKPFYSLKQVLGHLEVKENVFFIQSRPKKRIKTPLIGQAFGETSPSKMLLSCSGFYNPDSMKFFRILKSELHQALLFGAFFRRMAWKKIEQRYIT